MNLSSPTNRLADRFILPPTLYTTIGKRTRLLRGKRRFPPAALEWSISEALRSHRHVPSDRFDLNLFVAIFLFDADCRWLMCAFSLRRFDYSPFVSDNPTSGRPIGTRAKFFCEFGLFSICAVLGWQQSILLLYALRVVRFSANGARHFGFSVQILLSFCVENGERASGW